MERICAAMAVSNTVTNDHHSDAAQNLSTVCLFAVALKKKHTTSAIVTQTKTVEEEEGVKIGKSRRTVLDTQPDSINAAFYPFLPSESICFCLQHQNTYTLFRSAWRGGTVQCGGRTWTSSTRGAVV